jgi:hypothetical protein
MAIHKKVQPQKEVQLSTDKIGVSLKDVSTPAAEAASEKDLGGGEIRAYRRDVWRSAFAGLGAVGIELLLYFFHLVK